MTIDNNDEFDQAQRKAAGLAEIIQAERDSNSVLQAGPKRPTAWQRILFTVVLVAAALAPYFLPEGRLPASPPEFPAGVQAFEQIIHALPANAAVLVAVEYQPAYSGELERLAQPVLLDLMRRQARLVTVSTLTTGPLQAQNLIIAASQADGYPYQSPYEVLNLGYIPGERSGLKKLAAAGGQTDPESGYTLSGAAGLAPPMLPSASDFDLLWVISDNPDLARDWIEQVGPSLDGVPLVMSLSAQAGPLVRPYAGSQVQAMVVGLQEGAALEGWLGFMQPNDQTLASYNLATSTAVIMILILVFLNVLIRRRSSPGQGLD